MKRTRRAVQALLLAALLMRAARGEAQVAAPQMVLQLGHRGQTTAAAWSPDGALLATGGEEGTIRIWDTATGQVRRAWRVGGGDVRWVAYALDGRLLVSAGHDESIKIWDAGTGTLRRALPATAPFFPTPDGRCLLTHGRKAVLFDLESGTVRRRFDFPGDFGVAAFSYDGTMVALGGYRTLQLWDAHDGQHLRDLKSEGRAVQTLAFSPDGRLLVSGDDSNVRIWNVADGTPLRVLTAHLGAVTKVAFARDGASLLTVAGDALRVWDVATFERRRTVPATQNGFGEVALAADGRALAVTGRATGVLDLASGKTRWSVPARRDEPHNLALSPDGKTLTLTIGRGGGSSEVWVWRAGRMASSIAPSRVLFFKEDDVYDAAPLNGGATLFTQAGFALSRCDVQSGATRAFGDWEHGVSSLAVAPDGALAAAAYFTEPVRLFDARTGKLLRKLGQGDAPWNYLAFSPDSRWLATASEDQTVRLWQATSGRLQKSWTFAENPGEIVFSPTGRMMAGGGEDGLVWTWDAAGKTRPRLLSGHRGTAISVAFAPDGKTLASGGKDGTVRLWNAATGQLLRLWTVQDGAVHSVRFTPRGALLCATQHGAVQVWDAAHGQLQLTFLPLPAKNQWVAWTPAGFYDASFGAAPFLRWRTGAQLSPSAPQLHRPEIVARAWGF